MDIEGQDPAVERFRRILASGRLASTYLLIGPGGVGKRMFAQRLAKALFCSTVEPSKLAPCGTCQNCVLCQAGNHPDLLEVGLRPDKAQLVLEQFLGSKENRYREGFCFELARRPALATRRVAVIDDADTFSPEVANSLLKTLEEPPPRSLLLILGTSLAKQLPTIRSRAQVVRFQPLEQDHLVRLMTDLQLVEDSATAHRVATNAEGSLDRARQLANPELWQTVEEALELLARPIVDSVTLTKRMVEFTDNAGKEASAKRAALLAMLGMVTHHYRTLLLQQPDAPPATFWIGAIDRCLRAEEHVMRNAHLHTVIQCWADDLSRGVRC